MLSCSVLPTGTLGTSSIVLEGLQGQGGVGWEEPGRAGLGPHGIWPYQAGQHLATGIMWLCCVPESPSRLPGGSLRPSQAPHCVCSVPTPGGGCPGLAGRTGYRLPGLCPTSSGCSVSGRRQQAWHSDWLLAQMPTVAPSLACSPFPRLQRLGPLSRAMPMMVLPCFQWGSNWVLGPCLE